jgi:hypothetical protein
VLGWDKDENDKDHVYGVGDLNRQDKIIDEYVFV